MDHSDDNAAIRAIEEAYDAAWNRGDATALVEAVAADAVVVNPRGQVAEGKTAFAQIMTELLAGAFRGTTHESRITRIRYPQDDVAIVDGEATLRGADIEVVHPFTYVMVRRDGRWWIYEIRAYDLVRSAMETGPWSGRSAMVSRPVCSTKCSSGAPAHSGRVTRVLP